MPAEIRIYFEGHVHLKRGFAAFFRKLREDARAQRCGFELVASRSGEEACRDFGTAINAHPKAWNILLIDSEGPHHAKQVGALCKTHRWDQSLTKRVFWMVQMMEAWFHADPDALAKFYGTGFNKGALPGNSGKLNVESIAKKDLETGLSAATRKTAKGDYFRHKTAHGPELLARINPNLVRKAAPNCQRLFNQLEGHLGISHRSEH